MRLLDLYCGEGLAAWGYWLSGRFHEIVGVDNNNELASRYSFDFVHGDALALDYEFLMSFDFIHASPPCQGYSKATPKWARGNHMRLIATTHLMLIAAGKPYVIENVEGSGKELRPNLVMDGHYFGLAIERRRYFHVSTLEKPLRLMSSCPATHVHMHGDFISREQMIEAMGLGVVNEHRRRFLTRTGIEQGVPPAMTKRIAEMVLPNKAMIGEKLASFSYEYQAAAL